MSLTRCVLRRQLPDVTIARFQAAGPWPATMVHLDQAGIRAKGLQRLLEPYKPRPMPEPAGLTPGTFQLLNCPVGCELRKWSVRTRIGAIHRLAFVPLGSIPRLMNFWIAGCPPSDGKASAAMDFLEDHRHPLLRRTCGNWREVSMLAGLPSIPASISTGVRASTIERR